MSRRIFRALAGLLAALAPILLGGAAGSLRSMDIAMNGVGRPAAAPAAAPAWEFDPAKPTAAILLGDTLSEITDVLGPYAMFAASGRYNVALAAADLTPRTLTGGVEALPQRTFAQLDGLAGGPAIIVVPAIMDIAAPANRPALDWLRRRAAGGSIIFSWCTGAEVLAAAGLLDGKAATAHWADLGWLSERYPAVSWQRDVRYVDEGSILTSAGLTSGVDATLHLLSRLHGPDLARQVAQAIRYPAQSFAADPAAPAHRIAPADSVYPLNAAFYWPKRRLGLWLADGADELALAAVVDATSGSMTHEIVTLGPAPLIRTAGGALLLPRWHGAAPPAVDQLVVAGGAPPEPGMLATEEIITLDGAPGAPFAVEAALETIAAAHNGPT
ncbi:MAG TPA: DJ-1/PfpI family protein, partial [Herpetosiphonaceae bacterium]